MNTISIVVGQIIMMFLMMSVGYVCFKINFITNDENATLSKVALYIVIPFVVFASFQIDRDPQIFYGIFISFGLALVSHLIAILLCTFALGKGTEAKRIIEQFIIIYPNCGFMGIPLAQAVMGEKGVIYITAFMCGQNVLMWSHGISIMRGEFHKDSLKSIVTTPVMIAIFLGICGFIFQIRLPELLLSPIRSVGSMNTPLAMIISGIAVAQTKMLSVLKKIRTYYITLLKMIVVPLCMVVILLFVPVGKDIKMINILATAAPAAAIINMFALRFHRDIAYAAELFSLTTLVSAVTMPLMIFLGQMLF